MFLEIPFKREEIPPCLSERRLKFLPVLEPNPTLDGDFSTLHLDYHETIMRESYKVSLSDSVVSMPGDSQ